jgi:hypothetical protein
LNSLEKHGLGAITVELLQHRELICDKYSETFRDFESVLTSKFDGQSVSERLFTNICQTFTCAIILQANRVIDICESTDYEDILKEFSEIGMRSIIHQNQIQGETSIISEFMGIIQMLFEAHQIHEGIHFRFDQDYLLIRLPSIYTIFMLKYRQVHHKNGPQRDSIIQEIIKIEKGRSKDEIIKTIRFKKDEENKNTSLNSSVCNCISITYDIYCQRYGLNLYHSRER